MFEEDLLYPEITLETEDIIMNLIIKKDYSDIENVNDRKKEFVKDMKEFIEEFDQSPQSVSFFEYYDE